jgi:hypothetical protein
LGSGSHPRVRLAADLASRSPSSAAAGHLSRCLSALFDLDSPSVPGTFRPRSLGRTLALPPPDGLSVASALRSRSKRESRRFRRFRASSSEPRSDGLSDRLCGSPATTFFRRSPRCSGHLWVRWSSCDLVRYEVVHCDPDGGADETCVS